MLGLYGCKRDDYDCRDLKKVYNEAEIPQAEVETPFRYGSKSLIRFVRNVYNQGQLKSCTANAVCAAYAWDLAKQSINNPGGYFYFNPSRLFLYYNTRKYTDRTQQNTGVSIRDTIKALNLKGVCEESVWPYKIENFADSPPPEAYTAAAGNNLCKYERLNQDIDQLRACLNDDCPFVFGFSVYPSFKMKASKEGYLPIPSEIERMRAPIGRHAVMAVGYSDTKRCITVLNSYGPSWGSNGYFYMPYDFIEDPEMCSDFWKISFACQRGKPRPADSISWKDTQNYGFQNAGKETISSPRKYTSRFDAPMLYDTLSIRNRSTQLDSVSTYTSRARRTESPMYCDRDKWKMSYEDSRSRSRHLAQVSDTSKSLHGCPARYSNGFSSRIEPKDYDAPVRPSNTYNFRQGSFTNNLN